MAKFGQIVPFDETLEMIDLRALPVEDRPVGLEGPPYLSPTSLGLFWSDREEFFLQYIMRVGRGPTTLPMLVGSAFDAYVKSFLGTQLFGAAAAEALGLELGSLLADQVGDPVDCREAYAAGRAAFKLYVSCGALADLMLRIEELSDADRLAIRFEGDITDTVACVDGGTSSVKFRGKPDMSWVDVSGENVVLDWKVNGWCSSSTTSPHKGYRCVRPSGKVHKLWSSYVGDPAQRCFSEVKLDWARQLCIYGWLLGTPVGVPFRVMIDQLCGRDRVAHHEGTISEAFQASVMRQAVEAVDFIHRGVWPKDWLSRGRVILGTKDMGPLFR